MQQRFRIGLVIHDFGNEYSQELIKGISKFCKENSCDLFLFPIGELCISYWPFYYQNHSLISLISNKNLDGVIFAAATQCNKLTYEELVDFTKSLYPLPVVSVGYILSGVPSVTADCCSGLNALVQHLISKHNCKRIALMGVNNSSAEAKEREEVYRTVLIENKIPIDESIIMYGLYTYESAVNQLQIYYDKHGKLDFDAIVAINDNMAYGCIDFCNRHDIKDIIITGYDNITRASFSHPTLTTVSAELSEQGYEAANILLDMLNSKEVPSVKLVPSQACYRQSCGCVSLADVQRLTLNESGEIKKGDNDILVHGDLEWFERRTQIIHFSSYQNVMQVSIPLEELRKRIYKDISGFDIKKAVVCLYSQPVDSKDEFPCKVPTSAYLFVAFDETNEYKLFCDGETITPDQEIVFNPNESFLPSKVKVITDSVMITMPLFHCSM